MRFLASISLLSGILVGLAMPASAERTWVDHPDPELVRERQFAYAIDGVHRHAYRFGGTIDGVLSGELKRQDLDDPDLTWHLVPATPGPPPRRRARAWYDMRRERLLLLGGYDPDSTGHADVWSLDVATNTWSQPPISPGGPVSILDIYPMTYDSRRDRLVYVNDQGTDRHPRVWTLDMTGGTLTWSSLEPASTFRLTNDLIDPPIISVAAGDSLGNRLFLLGGLGFGSIDSLFVLDLSNPITFVKVPGVELGDLIPRIAVDAVGNRLVIDADDNFSAGPVLLTLDLANLASITSHSTDYQPTVERGVRVPPFLAWAIDPVAGTIEAPVQNEGRDTRSTLALGVPSWSFRYKTGRVRASDFLAGAIDPAAGKVYVYGGRIQAFRNHHDYTRFIDDALFRLDADDPAMQEWLHPPGDAPGPLQGAVAVLDSTGRRIVFVGGSDAVNLPRSEVWALDLEPAPHWSQLATLTEGPARHGAGAAIDPASRTLYMVGGTPPGGDPHPGWLWSLDLAKSPAEWTLRIAANPGFFGERMGYDRAHHRLLGVSAEGTFTIDLGAGGPPVLTQHEYPVHQQYRIGIMGAMDTKRNVLFAHGGHGDRTMTAYTGIYETALWTGDQFRDDLAALGEVPPSSFNGLMIHDPARDQLLILQGDHYEFDSFFYNPRDDFGSFGTWTLDLDDSVPARVDLAAVTVEPQGVRVRFAGAGAEGPLHVERAIDGTLEWTWLGDAHEVSPGIFEWVDATVVPGTSYRYRARFLSEGAEQTTAVSGVVSIPGTVEFALKAAGGAVGRGWPVVLEGQVRPGIIARVELVDVAGRVVSRRPVTGAFATSLAPQRPSAGIYFARLVQGDRTVVLKLVRF